MTASRLCHAGQPPDAQRLVNSPSQFSAPWRAHSIPSSPSMSLGPGTPSPWGLPSKPVPRSLARDATFVTAQPPLLWRQRASIVHAQGEALGPGGSSSGQSRQPGTFSAWMPKFGHRTFR